MLLPTASFKMDFPHLLAVREQIMKDQKLLERPCETESAWDQLAGIYLEISQRLEAHLLLKQKGKKHEHELLLHEQNKVQSTIEGSRRKNREVEYVLSNMRKTLASKKEELNLSHDKASTMKSEVSDKVKQLHHLRQELEHKEAKPIAEQCQLDFIRSLSHARFCDTQNEKKIKGYFVRCTPTKELKTFSFDLQKESRQSVLKKLWKLVEWSYETELKH